jgi:hypothetical protein
MRLATDRLTGPRHCPANQGRPQTTEYDNPSDARPEHDEMVGPAPSTVSACSECAVPNGQSKCPYAQQYYDQAEGADQHPGHLGTHDV